MRPHQRKRASGTIIGMDSSERIQSPLPRSAGAIDRRRVRLLWPEDREFRILSIDGGGIRGIFPAAFLAGLEERYLSGSSIGSFFDLIVGTSTGGVIGIGLGAGLRAAEIRDLYVERGGEIFPPMGATSRLISKCLRFFKYRYDREALTRVLHEYLGRRTLEDSRVRLCIPSCDGRYGDVYVFKTPHHPDFYMDGREEMAKVAAATAAAPTYFRPLEDGGYVFLDGGIWANNPVMVGLVDALSCFSVPPERIRILSLGCGDAPYTIGGWKKSLGGLVAWYDVIFGAMRFQSLSALGQAGLLIGADRVARIDPPEQGKKNIDMDDWIRARTELPPAATRALDESGDSVASVFLTDPIVPYRPFISNSDLKSTASKTTEQDDH